MKKKHVKILPLGSQIIWMGVVYVISVACVIMISYSGRWVMRWVLYGLTALV